MHTDMKGREKEGEEEGRMDKGFQSAIQKQILLEE